MLFVTAATRDALGIAAGDTVVLQSGLAAVALRVAGDVPGDGRRRLAVMDIAAAGFNVTESVRLLNPVLDLAAGSLGQLTPSQAAGLASQAMKAFGLSIDEASISVDRMLQAVRALAIDHRSSGVAAHVTISIGVASIEPSADASPDSLLRRADEALYRAKAQGRDRFVAD